MKMKRRRGEEVEIYGDFKKAMCSQQTIGSEKLRQKDHWIYSILLIVEAEAKTNKNKHQLIMHKRRKWLSGPIQE